ncbi:hypothetical protein OHAE_4364 [Ochrobactrum soli]|uniref:Uncharacterized protein n=1 Tax=Ochrobactrum soli TaxID=2448455 RepID=A0A2P9HBV0_9HYPH|nr:hypothetical protein OHAE_4364 [[Ochrobactrum] soli]
MERIGIETLSEVQNFLAAYGMRACLENLPDSDVVKEQSRHIFLSADEAIRWIAASK